MEFFSILEDEIDIELFSLTEQVKVLGAYITQLLLLFSVFEDRHRPSNS